MDISNYKRGQIYTGVRYRAAVWYVCSIIFFESGWFPFYKPKRFLLRLFGATVGQGVCLKPFVKIKFPWNLRLGDHVSIGERAWIDNLGNVVVGSNSVISQGCYLCTGNHDYKSPAFDLIIGDISIGNQCWVGAFSMVLPGAEVGDRVVIGAGSVVKGSLEGDQVHSSVAPLVSRKRP